MISCISTIIYQWYHCTWYIKIKTIIWVIFFTVEPIVCFSWSIISDYYKTWNLFNGKKSLIWTCSYSIKTMVCQIKRMLYVSIKMCNAIHNQTMSIGMYNSFPMLTSKDFLYHVAQDWIAYIKNLKQIVTRFSESLWHSCAIITSLAFQSAILHCNQIVFQMLFNPAALLCDVLYFLTRNVLINWLKCR